MIPKEKAEQLVKKFKQYVNSDVAGEQNFEFSHEEQLKNAKQCALIAVDEIINSCLIEPSDTDWDDCGGSFQYWYPQKHEDSLIFWEEVKQELQQL